MDSVIFDVGIETSLSKYTSICLDEEKAGVADKTVATEQQ